MGDFNYPEINWDTLEAGIKSEQFFQTIQDTFLFQHVMEPTRNNNILDLIFSSELDMIEDLEIGCPVANSDHNILRWNLAYNSNEFKFKRDVFDYNKGDFKGIIKEHKCIQWVNIFEDSGLRIVEIPLYQ